MHQIGPTFYFQRGFGGCSSDNFTAVLSRVLSRGIMDGQFYDPVLLACDILVAFFDGFAVLGPLNSRINLS